MPKQFFSRIDPRSARILIGKTAEIGQIRFQIGNFDVTVAHKRIERRSLFFVLLGKIRRKQRITRCRHRYRHKLPFHFSLRIL